jgi:hypothetical protein
MTETERIANVKSLRLIEVTPGWYIEQITDEDWLWRFVISESPDGAAMHSVRLTNNPLDAEDFSDEKIVGEDALASFPGAKLINVNINISKNN